MQQKNLKFYFVSNSYMYLMLLCKQFLYVLIPKFKISSFFLLALVLLRPLWRTCLWLVDVVKWRLRFLDIYYSVGFWYETVCIFSAKDEKEVAQCVKDLNSPGFYPTMISIWVTDSFERKDMERDLLAKLLINLSKSREGMLNQNHLIKGLKV